MKREEECSADPKLTVCAASEDDSARASSGPGSNGRAEFTEAAGLRVGAEELLMIMRKNPNAQFEFRAIGSGKLFFSIPPRSTGAGDAQSASGQNPKRFPGSKPA